MSARTVFTLAGGRGIDLLHPRVDDYADFFWQAEHLAKEPRYNGATANIAYSVAEHATRAADAAFKATRDPLIAAAVQLHDNPEALLRDEATPKKNAIAELIAEECGVLAPAILGCFGKLERRHEACVYQAAGLPWPLPERIAATVKHFDKVMFVTEWRDLMGNVPHPDWAPYEGIAPLAGPIRPWPFHAARYFFLQRCQRFLPVFEGRRALPLHELFPGLVTKKADGPGNPLPVVKG